MDRRVKPGGDDVSIVARMERSVIRDCREASMPRPDFAPLLTG
jgi:hypothetical protein